MYINYELLFKKDLTFDDLNVLFQINQKETVLLESMDFSKYENLGLVSYLSAPKAKHLSVRLSKEGKAFLDMLCTKGYTEEIGGLLTELMELYKYHSQETGNHLAIQTRLIWFIETTGFGPTAIKKVITQYLEHSDEYRLRLDNLIWKPASLAFSVHPTLKDSKLFELITKTFNLPINYYINQNRNAEENWLWDTSQIKIPQRLGSEFYFTGSYKTDIEFQQKMKKKLQEKISSL